MSNPLIVETIRVFEGGTDWVSFGVEVLSTAIGAFLGAILGFVSGAALAAQDRQKDRDKEFEAKKAAQLEVMREALAVCMANLESLLGYKRQMSEPLRTDSEALLELVEKDAKPEDIAKLAGTLPEFYKHLPRPHVAPLPPAIQMHFMNQELPSMPLARARLDGALYEVLEVIAERNNSLASYARGTPLPVNDPRWRYYTLMMGSAGKGIALLINDSLYFNDFMMRQISEFFDANFPMEARPRFNLMEKAKDLMPSIEEYKDFEGRFIRLKKDA